MMHMTKIEKAISQITDDCKADIETYINLHSDKYQSTWTFDGTRDDDEVTAVHKTGA